jgi:hypothetical protein
VKGKKLSIKIFLLFVTSNLEKLPKLINLDLEAEGGGKKISSKLRRDLGVSVN